MRCRNCHTAMMDTDRECPACHASAASATAAPPGPFRSPSGLVNALPVFGGAAGGLLAGAIIASQNAGSGSARGYQQSSASSGAGSQKWLFGLVLVLGGGFLLLAGFLQFAATWALAHRETRKVTAAELCQMKDTESAPAWMEYAFAESKPIDLTVKRRRLGYGGDVDARCLLVRVDEKWLLASVPTRFEGDKLVGRLLPLESVATQSLAEHISKVQPDLSTLLPYEFNAVDGSAKDQQTRYGSSGVLGVAGVLGLWFGLGLFSSKRP
jgi:hypothetical protein